MPTELISLLGGGVTGFLFRYWAQRAQDQKDMFKMAIEANKQTTDNQDKAAQRVPLDVGKGVTTINSSFMPFCSCRSTVRSSFLWNLNLCRVYSKAT
jgi:hypothetical protein